MEVQSCLAPSRCQSGRRSGSAINRAPPAPNWPRRSVWPLAPYEAYCSGDDSVGPKDSRRIGPDRPPTGSPDIRPGRPPCCCARSTQPGAPASSESCSSGRGSRPRLMCARSSAGSPAPAWGRRPQAAGPKRSSGCGRRGPTRPGKLTRPRISPWPTAHACRGCGSPTSSPARSWVP